MAGDRGCRSCQPGAEHHHLGCGAELAPVPLRQRPVGRHGWGGASEAAAPAVRGSGGRRVLSLPGGGGGVVYVGSFDRKLYAFDAAGTTGCSGTPKTCAPLWTGATGNSIELSSPAVA